MLKNNLVGRYEKLFFLLLLLFFCFFFSRKEQGRRSKFYENTGILLRVGALLFYFAFLLIKIAGSGV